MKKQDGFMIIPFILAGIIVLAISGYFIYQISRSKPAPSIDTQKSDEEMIQESPMQEEPQKLGEQPEVPASKTPSPEKTSTEQTPQQPAASNQQSAGQSSFQILADDIGFYINGQDINSISVKSGHEVKITFQVSTQNVYYNGLRFSGCGQNINSTAPGASTLFEFTAQGSCTITSYWPLSGVVKDSMQVVVQ